MEDIIYFSYGSNMLPARLQARCPTARLIGTAEAQGYKITFEKPGDDGSAKATLIPAQDRTYGALFLLDPCDLANLDAAEGAGHGYDRCDAFAVSHEARKLTAMTYIAPEPVPGLVAYDWYLALVLAGAQLNNLPGSHIEGLRATQWKTDPQPDRPGRLAGLQALASHGISAPEELLPKPGR